MNKDINQKNDSFQFLINSEAPSNVVFAIKESFKTIRTNIILSLPEEGCKKLVVTSSVPGEGKTTTSINVAIALSMADKKVLLVDLDLRKRRVGKLVKLKHYKGFADIIRGDATFEDLINETKYPNLHILAAGSSVVNPSEIVASKASETFFNSIADRYDYILFDAPPINIVSDALPLIRRTDGVLFVAREMLTSHKELKKALNSLNLINANILGVIYIGSDSNEPYHHSETAYGRYGKYGKYGRYGRYGYGKYGRYGRYGAYGKYEAYGYGEENSSKKQK